MERLAAGYTGPSSIAGPTGLKHLTVATGHYRNGILLAPITAKLVSEWIIENRVSMDWETV